MIGCVFKGAEKSRELSLIAKAWCSIKIGLSLTSLITFKTITTTTTKRKEFNYKLLLHAIIQLTQAWRFNKIDSIPGRCSQSAKQEKDFFFIESATCKDIQCGCINKRIQGKRDWGLDGYKSIVSISFDILQSGNEIVFVVRPYHVNVRSSLFIPRKSSLNDKEHRI